MSADTEDWLANEQFDFEVADSPALINESVGDNENKDDSDEEVFFGPQTHKERCVATVVKEREEENKIPTPLDPEQQALLLRESALVSLRIKQRNTPNSNNTRSSPIAIVHPMKREEPNQPTILKQNKKTLVSKDNKENLTTAKQITKNAIMTPKKNLSKSGVLQPSNKDNKVRPLSQPDFNQSRLPTARVRGKSSLEVSQDLVDQASLYGLNSTNSSQPVKRRSGLPTIRKVGLDSTSQTTKTSLLPQSAVSSVRTKIGGTSITDVKDTTSKNKPMKVLPQSQLRLPGRRKSLLSQGTPSKSSTTKKERGVPSNRSINKLSAKPTIEKHLESKKFDTKTVDKNLTTPVYRTPSRKIIARKLETKESTSSVENINSSDTSSDRSVKTSNETVEISGIQNQDKSEENPESSEHGEQSPLLSPSTTTTTLISTNNQPSVQPVVETNDGNIANQYNSQLTKQIETTDEPSQENSHSAREIEKPLLDLGFDDEPKYSPLKSVDLFMDPFQTGHTPPPLIDIGEVLEPEKPKEVLLIEF